MAAQPVKRRCKFAGFGFRELQRQRPYTLGLDGNEALAWAIILLWSSLMPVLSLDRKMGPLLEMLIRILSGDLVAHARMPARVYTRARVHKHGRARVHKHGRARSQR